MAMAEHAASSATSKATKSFGFSAKLLTSAAVFLVAAPSAAYYLKFYRPRYLYQKHLEEMAKVPRPYRKTKLFVAGNEPLKSLEKFALNVDLKQDHSSRLRRWWRSTMVPFYAHVVARMFLLIVRTVPVAWNYLAARYGLLGYTYDDAHRSVKDLLEAMGPSFIKLGQWAATRPDLFSTALCDALSPLFDAAPPHKWADTKRLLNEAGIASQLVDLDEKPLKSGSVGQVHRAKLKDDYVVLRSECDEGTLAALGAKADGDDEEIVVCPAGTQVVLKVMHPGVREQIAADSAALRFIGATVTKLIPGSEFMSLQQTAEEVCGLALSQLDLEREADNLIEFRFNFRDSEGHKRPQVTFPLPLAKLSNPDILVETFEKGESLNDENADAYEGAGKIAMHTFMKMLFEDNLVHADLHPGNMLFRMLNPDGSYSSAKEAEPGAVPQLVLLDPGLVTSLSERERTNFISLFAAVASGDGALGAELMYKNGPGEKECTDVEKFKTQMSEIFDTISPGKIGSFNLGDISIGEKLTKVMEVMRENKVRIDMNFATIVSTVMVGEGMGKRLVPDFNLMEHALPFLIKCLRSHELEYLVSKVQETYLTLGALNV